MQKTDTNVESHSSFKFFPHVACNQVAEVFRTFRCNLVTSCVRRKLLIEAKSSNEIEISYGELIGLSSSDQIVSRKPDLCDVWATSELG